MPKYKPSSEELYTLKPCAICGLDTLSCEDTCSDMCAYQLKSYEEDLKWFQMKEFLDNLDRENK